LIQDDFPLWEKRHEKKESIGSGTYVALNICT